MWDSVLSYDDMKTVGVSKRELVFVRIIMF